VPHRNYPQANSPWAPPGQYTVRLAVAGQHYTQPLTLKLDPRVKTTPAGLAQLTQLSRQLYDDALSANEAFTRARALSSALAGATDAATLSYKATLDSIAPAPTAAPRRRGFAAAGPAGPPTFVTARDALIAASMAMQGAEAAPTAREISAGSAARAMLSGVLLKWKVLSSSGLADLNAKRKAAGLPALRVPD
jgi:hypothetical protein